MTLLVAWLVLTATHEVADLGVHALDTCPVESVAFRTSTEAFASDWCGYVYRSTDGGKGWARDVELEEALLVSKGQDRRSVHLTWLTPQLGLAFPQNGERASRTTNAGKTWSKLELAPERIYALEVVAHHLWACTAGKNGLEHSTDDGVSWSAVRDAHLDGTRWLSSAFVDEHDGWVLSARKLLKTTDGGASWSPVNAPDTLDSFRQLVRFSSSVAWVLTANGAHWRSLDGGESWSAVAIDEHALPEVVALPDGRKRPVLGHPSEDPASWVPAMKALAAATDSAAAFDADVANRGPAIREDLLLSQKTGKVVPLDLTWQKAGTPRWGTAGTRVFRATKAGEWYASGELPAPPTTIASLENETLLAMVAGTLLLRPLRATWQAADDLDWVDWERVNDLRPSLERNMACLQYGPGRLLIDATWNALEPADPEIGTTVLLSLDDSSAHLTFDTSGGISCRSLDLASGRALARRLADATFVTTGPSPDSAGLVTTLTRLVLRWSCRGGPEHAITSNGIEYGSKRTARANAVRAVIYDLLHAK
jgi:photosystem II stability/assembly factor-like uncharacterized protein